MRTTTPMRRALKGPRQLAALILLGLAMSACAAFPSAALLQAGAAVGGSAAAPANGAVAAVQLGSSTALPPSSSIIGRFAPVYMGSHWNFSLAQAITLAKEFDVIAAQSNVFSKYASAMKAAKPNLRIIAYVNGMFDLTSGGTAYPSSWYAHDAKGARIRSTFGNYLLNPGNSSWAQSVAKQCSDAIAKSHYDGCFLDTLGTAPLDPGYCTGLAIDPATGKVWTQTQWLQATSTVAKTVQSSNPNAIVMDNGLADGQKYYNPSGSTEPLIAATHVGMVELWLRSNGTPANKFKTEAEWLQDVNMIINAQAQGFSIATTTKLWVPASSAQQAAWEKYALASFLMAANGKAYFSFMPNRTNSGLTYDSALEHLAIGTPTGTFKKVGGLYERTFTHGIAEVNVSGSPVTLTVAAGYRNLAGQFVTSETLPPNSGDVFVTG
jgi:Hypothetical glycosyl hydrolase family 15